MWYNFGAILMNLIASIYRTVARSYNLMLDFTTEVFSSDELVAEFGKLTDSIYTLIAIFMLFRITVTMIEYLIDPDKITDKSTGVGKIITRIIISLVLVISFPLILSNVVDPLERAILSEDSILYTFFDSGTSSQENSAFENSKQCEQNCSGVCGGKNDAVCITEPFYSESNLNSSLKADTVDFDNNYTYQSSYTRNAAGYKLSQNYVNSLSSQLDDKKANGKSFTGNLYCKYNGIQKSCSEFLNDGITYYTLKGETGNQSLTSYNFYVNLTTDISESYELAKAYSTGRSSAQVNWGISPSLEQLNNTSGMVFAKSLVKSFTSFPEKIDELEFLINPKADEKLAKAVEEKEIDFDMFTAIIVGVVIICFLLILCIEIVIRGFKLLLLEVVAPIAFISYMNPNDKVLNNWFQKYVGTYLDLFIKILAIRIAVFSISTISDSIKGMAHILLIIGIFIFAKTIPNLISDLFGIKNMGGTFKESMGALKNAAFTGAGAIAGAGAGLVTGLGKGASFSTAVGGLFGGALRGAQGGMKGKVLQGATEQAKRNNAVKQTNINGGNWWQRRLASIGMDDATRVDKQIAKTVADQKQFEDFSKLKDNAENIADSSNYMKSYSSLIGEDGNKVHTPEQIKAEREKWSKQQLAMKELIDSGKYRFNENGDLEKAIDSIKTSDGKVKMVWEKDREHHFDYKYEASKAAGIATQIERAENTRRGLSLFNGDKSFESAISSFEDFDKATTEAKIRSEAMTTQIEATKHTNEYIAADASRKKGN